MSKYKEQVTELNTYVKVKVAPSPVHGVGLFALRDIPKGEKLYADMMTKVYDVPFNEFKQLFPEIRELLLGQWPRVVTGSRFAYPAARLQAYINHSDAPNYDPVKDEVLHDIKQGEEVFEDYRQIEGWEKAHPWLFTVDN